MDVDCDRNYIRVQCSAITTTSNFDSDLVIHFRNGCLINYNRLLVTAVTNKLNFRFFNICKTFETLCYKEKGIL